MKNIIFVFLLVMIGMQGCATQETASGGVILNTDTDDIISYENFRDLADYLRRIPGVQITGAGDNINVQIRGASSFTSETRPLCVVDGQIREIAITMLIDLLSGVKLQIFVSKKTVMLHLMVHGEQMA